MKRTYAVVASLALAFGSFVPSASILSQTTRDSSLANSRYIAVTIIAIAGGGHGHAAEVLSRAKETPMNVIVVDPSRVTASDLAGALATLSRMTARFGTKPSSNLRGVSSTFAPSAAWNRNAKSKLEGYLKKLESSPIRNVAGVGRGRTIYLWYVPSKRS